MEFTFGEPDILLEGDEEDDFSDASSVIMSATETKITDLSASYSSLQSPSSLSASFRFTSTKPRLRRSSSARASRSNMLEQSVDGSESRCTVSLPVTTPFGKKLAKLPDIRRSGSCDQVSQIRHTALQRTSSLPHTMQGRSGSQKNLAKLPHYPVPGHHLQPGHTDGASDSSTLLSSSLNDADSQLRYWGDLLQASRANTPLLSLSQSDNFTSSASTPRPFSVSLDEGGHRSIRESRGHAIKTPIKEETPAWLVELKGRKHVSMDEVENLAALMNSCKTPSMANSALHQPSRQTLHTPREPPSYMKSTEASLFKRKKGSSSSLSLNSSFNSSQ